tara:strand:+ start:276 stop:434 length:159 start_codon:yes stop_codon:yes gene_type:complete
MKRLHRLFMWFYGLGYDLWLKIGKVMYWDDVMLVKEVDTEYLENKIDVWNDE